MGRLVREDASVRVAPSDVFLISIMIPDGNNSTQFKE